MNITSEFATQDDCLDRMVPSDLRQLVRERDAALTQNKRMKVFIERTASKFEGDHHVEPSMLTLMRVANEVPAGSLATQNAELVAQVSQQQSFIEDVMANIGAGATLAEVTDMLCNWWDVRILPAQCLRDVEAKAALKGYFKGADDAWKDLTGGNSPEQMTAHKATQYAARVRAGDV